MSTVISASAIHDMQLKDGVMQSTHIYQIIVEGDSLQARKVKRLGRYSFQRFLRNHARSRFVKIIKKKC